MGAGGVAVKQVLLNQGAKQAAKLVARGMAKAGTGLAVGFLSEQAMIKAGIKPEHAQLAMKGAELFFAWKMLKVARMASAAKTATDNAFQRMLKAGGAIDKGDLTKAGRALQKHGSRPGSVFPQATGNPAAMNQQGQTVLQEILSSPSQ